MNARPTPSIAARTMISTSSTISGPFTATLSDCLPLSSSQRYTPADPCRKLMQRRSEEHTSELQSQSNLVCRLLLEKKKKYNYLRDHTRLYFTDVHASEY